MTAISKSSIANALAPFPGLGAAQGQPDGSNIFAALLSVLRSSADADPMTGGAGSAASPAEPQAPGIPDPAEPGMTGSLAQVGPVLEAFDGTDETLANVNPLPAGEVVEQPKDAEADPARLLERQAEAASQAVGSSTLRRHAILLTAAAPGGQDDTAQASEEDQPKAEAAPLVVLEALAVLGGPVVPAGAPQAASAAEAVSAKLGDLPVSAAGPLMRQVQQPASLARSSEQSAPSVSGETADTASVPSLLDGFANQLMQADLGAPLAHSRPSVATTPQALATSAQQGPLAETDLGQLDALVRDIAELSGSSGRAAFRVAGREVGQLEVQLRTTDAGIAVNIRTQTEQSHAAVSQAQGQLTDDMRANGLKVAATSVMVGQGGADRQRDDRHPLPRHAPIETASSGYEQDQPSNEQRRSGRYA